MEFTERAWLIELLAYWEGRVNTRVLIQHLGLSRQQCSAELNSYNKRTGDNLVYDASAKAYCPGPGFKRHCISGDVSDYLNWVQGSPTATLAASQSNPHLPTDVLALPARKVAPEVMRGLVAAIRQQKRIEVDYVSLNNPNREGRVIAPHTFIKTGLRWHLRAWCEKSQDYRDFVLSRFRGTPELLDKTTRSAENDIAWNNLVTLILQPDPRLSPDKRAVIENDYQMENGQLQIRTRACLANYLLREMQINVKMLDGTPEAQQLVLVNLVDIKRWLFEG